MFTIPANKESSFIVALGESGIPLHSRGTYMKWVRYYIDFCQKYKFTEAKEDSLSPFIDKLRQKRQTSEQRDQASQAIKLYLGQAPDSLSKTVRIRNNQSEPEST